MSKYSLLLLVMLSFFAACDKSEEDDLSGTAEMNGKLYSENVYESEPAKMLPDHEVFLLKDTSAAATSFFFSGQSDNSGYFSMEFLKPEAFYRLHAEKRMNTTQNMNVLFTADAVLQPTQRVSLVMRPNMEKQNGLYLICTDDRIPAGRIPAVKIFFYTSRLLAELNLPDIEASTTHTYMFTSQPDGTVFKVNLPQDVYYVNAIIKVGTTVLKCEVKELSRLGPAGVVTETIVLR